MAPPETADPASAPACRASVVPVEGTSRALAALLLGLLAAGCALRFHQLGQDGLWTDELFTSSMVLQHPLTLGPSAFRRTTVLGVQPGDTFWTAKGAEQSPPLFELLTKAVVTLVGPSEASLRLVSALAGCVWLVFLTLRAWRARGTLLGRAYLAALALGAVSVFLVEYAQEARAYELGALFAGVLAARWMERWAAGFTRARAPGAGELALFVLGCYTHYDVLVFCALLLLTYGAVALWARRWGDLARLALVPLAFLPWAFLNAHTIRYTSRGAVRWRDIGVAEALAGAARCALELPGKPVLALAGAALVVAAARYLAGRNAADAEAVGAWRTLGALAALAPVYVVIIGLVTMRAGMMHPRYYLFLLPALHVGAGLLLALATHGEGLRGALAAGFALALTVASALPALRDFYPREREGYREATHWLRENARSDAALLYTWAPNLAVYRFYLKREFGQDADTRAMPISGLDESEAVCARLGDAPQVALIAHYSHRPWAQALLAACGTKYRLERESEIYGVLAQVWAHR